jgi:hypothetical protein
MYRTSGTGTAYFYLTDVNRQFEIALADMGAIANVGGSLAQKSKASGTPAPSPTATYTKSWSATWGRSYDGDNGVRNGDDTTTELYQGYYSGTHGNTRSLAGFDYSSIMSALSGATGITAKLTFKVKHAYEYAGLDTYIGAHNYSSKPGSWAAANVAERRLLKSNAVEGSTYTVTLPSDFGTNFKSGAWRGIAFGPAPSNAHNYYGYVYVSGLKLTLTYTK